MRVELVDQSGSIVPTSVKGFQNLGAGSTITVKGTLKKGSKGIKVIATQFYPG